MNGTIIMPDMTAPAPRVKSLEEQVAEQLPQKGTPKQRRTNPLTTLSGLLLDASRGYRKMKAERLNHEKGRSPAWALTQMRSMAEAQYLERIEAKLNLLSATAHRKGWMQHGHDGATPQTRLPN